MPRDIAGAALLHSARTKRKWISLLSRNKVMWPLTNIGAVSKLQDTTLAEFQSLLQAQSFRSWVHKHEPHTRLLHSQGICGFISVLSYFATGELALFEELRQMKGLSRKSVSEARRRWRFFGLREMDAQCIGCEKICALVKYPEDPSAMRSEALPSWELLSLARVALPRRAPA
jgi:hypothetical protein